MAQAVADQLAWVSGLIAATVLRFEFDTGSVHWTRLLLFVPLAVALQVLGGWFTGLYKGRRRVGSFEEVANVVAVAGWVTLILAGLDVWALDRPVPLSAALMGGVLALVAMAGTRYAWRLWTEHLIRPRVEDCRRVIVFGAGEAGARIVTAMLRTPNSAYYPVALLDDDLRRASSSIKGIRVEGTRDDLERVARRHQADGLLIAIPSADAGLIRQVSGAAASIGLATRILPSVAELVEGSVGVGDIRKVTERDLLGRHQISLDIESIAHYLTGKRVLVTGAGGSIGSELCRQVHHYEPDELVMLDRDESALHAVEMSIHGTGLLQSPTLVVACIRDRERVFDVFRQWRPEVVFHAAALKHLPLLELHPREAVKTNVFGTINVIDASAAAGVQTFVNVSTDKAAEPSSVLGYTKLLTERITAHAACRADGTYMSVRFGNVLGSRGSVIETFREQIAKGGPVTVTHPDVERFFMTVEEAVQLVIQAGAVGGRGETLVLEMGEPVAIADIARRMIANASEPVEMVFTGLRPGEKMREVLFSTGERPRRQGHPLLHHIDGVAFPPEALEDLRTAADDAAVVARLRELCTSTVSAESAVDATVEVFSDQLRP